MKLDKALGEAVEAVLKAPIGQQGCSEGYDTGYHDVPIRDMEALRTAYAAHRPTGPGRTVKEWSIQLSDWELEWSRGNRKTSKERYIAARLAEERGTANGGECSECGCPPIPSGAFCACGGKKSKEDKT